VRQILAVFIGIALGGIAGAVLAISSLIDAGKFLGPGRTWFEPYFKLGGVALACLILATAFLVIGIGVGRWRRPVPSHHRRDQEVRW
jgi:hypothetical protein